MTILGTCLCSSHCPSDGKGWLLLPFVQMQEWKDGEASGTGSGQAGSLGEVAEGAVSYLALFSGGLGHSSGC